MGIHSDASDFVKLAMDADWDAPRGWLAAAKSLFRFSLCEAQEWERFQHSTAAEQRKVGLILGGRSPKWVALATTSLERMLNIPTDYSRRKGLKVCQPALLPELAKVKRHAESVYRLLCQSWKGKTAANYFDYVDHWPELQAAVEQGLKAIENVKLLKRFVIIPEGEYEQLCSRASETVPLNDDSLPPLPQPDKNGNFPAVQYARISLARDIIRDRRAAGLTQQQLAKLANTRQETISRIESGKYTASVKLIERIDRALEKRLAKKRK